MGTNYYLQCPACTCCGRSAPDIHLGKLSGGWAFHFHGQRPAEWVEEPVTNYAEWRARIVRHLDQGAVVVDEYGDPISLEALEGMIEMTSAGLSPYRFCLERYPHSPRSSLWEDEQGHSFDEAEFS